VSKKLVTDYMTVEKQLISFQPETDIYFAIETLINRAISGAPVVDKKGNLVGVLSEKDCLRVLMEMGMHDMPAGLVEEFMTKEVVTMDSTKTILDAVWLFRNSSFRRFPIVEGKKLVGLLTRRDVLRAVKDIK
jgi:predicted transcriptional regulator